MKIRQIAEDIYFIIGHIEEDCTQHECRETVIETMKNNEHDTNLVNEVLVELKKVHKDKIEDYTHPRQEFLDIMESQGESLDKLYDQYGHGA